MPIVINHSDLMEEVLTPDPDGVETNFQTSMPYRVDTLSLWLDGVRIISALDNGYFADGGTTVVLKQAPLVGTTLEARYDPT